MKIFQVMPVFGMGGAEIMCENLVYELKKLGHDVIVISLYDTQTAITKRFSEAGIDVRFLHKKIGFDFSMFKKIFAILKKEKPDIVHTHIYTTKYVFPLALLLNIKVVHTVHSVATKEATKASRILNKMFFKYFNIIPVALSENIRQTIEEEYKLKPDKIPVVFNGIDLSKCNKKENYIANDVFKIVHVGSFLEVKNHIGMIDAFESFHKKYPDSQLHLIGDSDRRVYIEQLVRDKKLDECIIFHGLQANVHVHLKNMDVFTLPSLYEGVPMSIIEAMGTGLPIVATKVGGIQDMLDEESAILVPVDSDAIAQGYERYYEDEELRKKHGLEALKRADKFSAETMAKKYVEIYMK